MYAFLVETSNGKKLREARYFLDHVKKYAVVECVMSEIEGEKQGSMTKFLS